MKYTKHAVAGLFATSVLLTGCTAPAKTAEARKEKPKAVKQEAQQQEDAPQYNSIGSWIPRKGKKKEDVIGTNTVTASGEALEKVNASASTRVPTDGPGPTGR